MVFETLAKEATDQREVFNTLYGFLPRVQFQENWLANNGDPIYLLKERGLTTSASTTMPDGRRVLFILTEGGLPLVAFDKWAGRADMSPLGYAYPEGFDMIDAPFEFLRRSYENVLAQWVDGNRQSIGTSDIIMPSIQKALSEELPIVDY